MKKNLILLIVAMTTLFSCGPSANDKAKIKQAILDSIKKADTHSLFLENTEVKYLNSKVNGINYKLFVYLPSEYYTTKDSFPVIYLLDADKSFPLAYYIVDHLIEQVQIPQSIIIGIAYKDNNHFANRNRDYTPVGIVKDSNNMIKYGGATQFKEFIKDELFKFVGNQYRVKNEKTLVGKSLGGLFASWILMTELNMFNNYVIISPPLVYSEGKIFDLFKSFHPKQDGSHCAYLAIGGLENKISMVDPFKKFYKLLYESGFDVQFDLFPNDNHYSILPAGMTRGLIFTQNKNNIKKLNYFQFDLNKTQNLP